MPRIEEMGPTTADLTLPIESRSSCRSHAADEGCGDGTQRDSDATIAHPAAESRWPRTTEGSRRKQQSRGVLMSSQPAGNPVREQSERWNRGRGRDYYYDHGGETYSENFPG